MLITGGTVVDVDGERRSDVRIGADGRIAELAPTLVPSPSEPVHDARGSLVIPGGIDAHTHLHLPVGAVHAADDFASGTRAAAIGGTTTVIDYVTAYRGEDPLAALDAWKRRAEPSAVDWALHMTFTEEVEEHVVAECVERGITSFKLYMAYPELLQVPDDVILRIMQAVARHGGLVTLHAENGGAIEALRREALAAGRTAVFEHSRTRPAILEGEATTRGAALAEVAGCPLYIVHLSSAPALEAVRVAQARGLAVQAETCPQYLYLDASRLEGPDAANFVCTPPLRDPWHAEELWEGLARGWIHTVATDHCPFTTGDRRRGIRGRDGGFGDFTEIPGGLPGIETRLALVWGGVSTGRLSASDWVRLCAEAPARTFGLWPAKGSLRVGADADIVVWDPERRQSLDASSLHMNVDHSPYEGTVSRGWPALVTSRGRVVASDGAFTGEPGWGRYLARGPATGVRRG